ncbi:alpha/beta fold hydrolase [Anaerolineae bacterium CFX9]|nr:alpha/beta fold hydrolase [Anaerolineae bacterium CFX9]
MAVIMPGAEPYWLPAPPHLRRSLGCLILHGFTSSPGETRWLGQALAARGYDALGVRLAGHGVEPEALARTRWQDWLASALDGYHLLRGQHDQIVVIGHSAGGVVSLLLSLEVPVIGVGALAAPMMIRQASARSARWTRFLFPFTDQTDRTELGAIMRAEQARRGEPPIGRIRYDRWPSAAVAQMVSMVAHMRSRLAEVCVPLLLVYSQNDPTVSPENAAILVREARAPFIRQHWLERSGHNVTVDVEREQVFAAAAAFCDELAKQKG